MSFFSKLMFWKKEPATDIEHFDKQLNKDYNLGLGEDISFPEHSEYPYETPQPTASSGFQFQQPITQPQASQEIIVKNIEVLSYKIDALKAAIDSMNQRLANLERIANQSQQRW